MFDVVAEFPMLALILQLDCHADTHRLQIGVVNIGRNDHAPARDLRLGSTRRVTCSRLAMYSISSVMTPWRA